MAAIFTNVAISYKIWHLESLFWHQCIGNWIATLNLNISRRNASWYSSGVNICTYGLDTIISVYYISCLRNGRVAITDTIKRSALQTFARRTDDTKNRSKVIAQRKDISLVSTLFLSLQSRPDFDFGNFFKYENQKEPPSLSDQGKLRSGTKSDVLQCLTIPKLTPPDEVTVKVLDGPAVVHMVRPTYGTNYRQYVVRHFMPFITNSLTNSTSRLDIIWDI